MARAAADTGDTRCVDGVGPKCIESIHQTSIDIHQYNILMRNHVYISHSTLAPGNTPYIQGEEHSTMVSCLRSPILFRESHIVFETSFTLYVDGYYDKGNGINVIDV